jgi:hypothetical protein
VPAAKSISAKQRTTLLKTLSARFEKNVARHPRMSWDKVLARLEDRPEAIRSLHEMEQSGGEPDVVGQDAKSGEIIFYDCAAETPKDRRSLCYDGPALHARKEAKPRGSAADMASAMGVELLSEQEYRELQELGEFDTKTSSWLKTPPAIRKLGGAMFGDRRYGHVFIYHNGVQSYYAGRGFRGSLRV